MNKPHGGLGARHIAASLILGSLSLLPALAQAALPTPDQGILSGSVSISASTQSGNELNTIEVGLTELGVQSSPQSISLSFNPGVTDQYGGGFSVNGYNHSGSISLIGLPQLTPGSGLVLDDVQVTVSGTYAMTGASFLYFNNFSDLRHGNGTFSFTSSLAELANRQNVMVSWFGAHPYVEGSGGVANTFSTLSVDVNEVTVRYNMSAIPEPASLAMMGLGLLGVAVAARRRTH